MSDWKEYEKLVEEIQGQIVPGAEVIRDVRIKGASGETRQFDVIIRKGEGPYRMFVGVECKRWRRPVGLKEMEAFSVKIRDVGGQGVMVSRNGFSGPAERFARRNFIRIFSLREAKDFDWRRVMGNRLWVRFVAPRIDLQSVRADCADGGTVEVDVGETLFDENGRPVCTVAELARGFRKQAGEMRRVGPFRGSFGTEEKLCVREGGRSRRVERFHMEGRDCAVAYALNLELASGEVFEDVENQAAVFTRLRTVGLDWQEILRSQGGMDLTEDEYNEYQKAKVQLPLDLNQAKKFLRIVVTHKGSAGEKTAADSAPRTV